MKSVASLRQAIRNKKVSHKRLGSALINNLLPSIREFNVVSTLQADIEEMQSQKRYSNTDFRQKEDDRVEGSCDFDQQSDMSSAETVSDENAESFARPLLNRRDESADMNDRKMNLVSFTQDECELPVPFSQYYKNKYGRMPRQNRGQTYVKDYLRKFKLYRKGGHLDKDVQEGGILFAKANSVDMINIRNDIDMDTRSTTVRARKNFNPLIKREPDWTYKVVFVRHGQSIWNKAGRFSGWIDVPLNEIGVQEARQAGQLLKEHGYRFDLAFTSMLDRAYKTLDHMLEEMDQKNEVRIHQSWKINERHYGSLEGLCKHETAKIYGKDQVKLWRQSYDNPPPFIGFEDEKHPRFDPLYSDVLEAEHRGMPLGESLKMVRDRITPYWNKDIIGKMIQEQRKDKNPVIAYVAHQHVLRGMVQNLTGIDNEAVMDLRIPNAAPFVFEFDQNLVPIRNYYLGESEDVPVTESTKVESYETRFMASY